LSSRSRPPRCTTVQAEHAASFISYESDTLCCLLAPSPCPRLVGARLPCFLPTVGTRPPTPVPPCLLTDETCPFSTERGTRRVQLVREGGGGGGRGVKMPHSPGALDAACGVAVAQGAHRALAGGRRQQERRRPHGVGHARPARLHHQTEVAEPAPALRKVSLISLTFKNFLNLAII